MPTLIPEFARALMESNRRAATSMHEEVQRLESLRQRVEALRELKATWETLPRRLARVARAATRDIVSEAQDLSDLWSAAMQSLREGLPGEEQLVVLQAVADLAASGRDFHEAVRRSWAAVASMGGPAEDSEQLAGAGRLFDQVYREATWALEARTAPWKPADSARLEQGRQEIREGKAIAADEARNCFRKKRG